MLIEAETSRERHPEDGPSDSYRVLAAVVELSDRFDVALRGVWRLTDEDSIPQPLHVLDARLRAHLEDAALTEFQAVRERGEHLLDSVEELANLLATHVQLGIETGNIDRCEKYVQQLRRLVLDLSPKRGDLPAVSDTARRFNRGMR